MRARDSSGLSPLQISVLKVNTKNKHVQAANIFEKISRGVLQNNSLWREIFSLTNLLTLTRPIGLPPHAPVAQKIEFPLKNEIWKSLNRYFLKDLKKTHPQLLRNWRLRFNLIILSTYIFFILIQNIFQFVLE